MYYYILLLKCFTHFEGSDIIYEIFKIKSVHKVADLLGLFKHYSVKCINKSKYFIS